MNAPVFGVYHTTRAVSIMNRFRRGYVFIYLILLCFVGRDTNRISLTDNVVDALM